MNFDTFMRSISKSKITFLIDLDKTINVNKEGKSRFHKMFLLEFDYIKDFIMGLDDQVYMITPFVSTNCRLDLPYVNVSRQFLVTRDSNFTLIHNFLYDQLEMFKANFNMDDINDDRYFLLFKYKSVQVDPRIFK